MMTSGKTLRPLLWCLALVCAAQSSWASEGARKYVMCGWDLKWITPQDVLRNAEKFRDAAFDGLTFHVAATNSCGEAMMYPAREERWERKAVEPFVEPMRRVLEMDPFRDSFLFGFSSPSRRLAWTDDAGWARIATNMAVLGWYARACGIEGIECDLEDYYKVRQYFRCPGDPPTAELKALVRRRAAQVFGALLREQPEAKLLFLWILNDEPGYMNCADPVGMADALGDLTPAFFDGILDVMPETARLINGDENCYFADYTSRSYHKSYINNFNVCPKFLSPENRAKYLRLSQVSFGFYSDMLVHPEGHGYYLAPINGCRAEHFRRNLRDATELATEYVWIWGERHPLVDWEDARIETRVSGKGTWDEVVPGFYEAMRCCKDSDRGLDRRLRDLARKGLLKDLCTNPSCSPREGSDAIPAPYETWCSPKEKGGRFFVDRSAGCGDGSCLAMEGVRKGCLFLTLKDLPPGGTYAITFACRGNVRSEVNYRNHGAWVRSQERYLIVPGPAGADGWRRAKALVVLPEGVDTLSLTFGDALREGASIRVDDVHVHPIDFTAEEFAK